MKKRIISILVSVIIATLLLSGCGSSKNTSEAMAMKAMGNGADYASAVAEEAMMYDEMPVNADSGEVTVNDTSRKLIKNADMTVETEDLSALMDNLNSRINEYGGYVESSYVDNGNQYSSYRNASLTVRIPSDKLDAFINNIGEVSNVLSKNLSVVDITLEYVDTEAKRSSLETEQKRLLELMDRAETIDEIIVIEQRLSEVRYELESAERQIRSYDNQVDYSTVNIQIREVVKYTPVEERSRWQEMTEGFMESLVSVGEGLLDFGVGFVIALPFIIVWAIIIAVIVLIVMGIVKGSKKRKTKKLAKAYAKAQTQAPTQAQTLNQAQAQALNQAQTQAVAQSQLQAENKDGK